MKKSYETNSRVWKKALNVFLALVLCFGMMPISDTLAKSASSDASAQTEQTEQKATDDSSDSSATDSTNKDATDDSNKDASDSDTNKDSTDKKSDTNSSSDKSADSNADSKTNSNSNTNSSNNSNSNSTDSKEGKAKEATKNNELANKAANAETEAAAELASAVTTNNMYEGSCRVKYDEMNPVYCATLDDAIEYANENAGTTIEIYRDTQLSGTHNLAKAVTIKNMVDPKSLSVVALNPAQNGQSTGTQTATDGTAVSNLPVVNVSGQGKININSGGSITFEGAIFDGTNSGVRSDDVIVVNNGGSLTINNGVAGTDYGIAATQSEFKNFTRGSGYGNVFRAVGGTGGGRITINAGLFHNNTNTASYGGCLLLYAGGTVTITGANTKFYENKATYGGAICSMGDYSSGSQSLTISGGTFTSNQATNGQGGALYIHGDYCTANVTGGTFQKNKATGNGAAISNAWGTLKISGSPTVTENVANAGGAVYVNGGERAGRYFYIQGAPKIINNNGSANLYIANNTRTYINGALDANARIGVSGLVAEGTKFLNISSGHKANTLPYLSCFSNDTNTTYVPDVTLTGTEAKWVSTSSKGWVCYINNSGVVTYYKSINAAVDGRNSMTSVASVTIEIFKSHEFSVGATAGEKALNLTTIIKNVSDPLNFGTDWKWTSGVNGGAEPVVKFTNSADRFSIGAGTTAFKGVIFDGNSDSNRKKSALQVKVGAVLKVEDGTTGYNPNGKELKTNTEGRNFRNTVYNSNTDAGGFVNVLGTLEMNGGTYYGNQASSYYFAGGGSVVFADNGGIVTFKNLTIRDNYRWRNNWNDWQDSPVMLYKSCVFTVENCKAYNNTGCFGGVVSTINAIGGGNGNTEVDYSEAQTVSINGGEFYNNDAYGSGGFASFNCDAKLKNCKIYNNFARGTSGAIDERAVITLGEGVEIYNNTTTNSNPSLRTDGVSGGHVPAAGNVLGYGAISLYNGWHYAGRDGKTTQGALTGTYGVVIEGNPKVYNNGYVTAKGQPISVEADVVGPPTVDKFKVSNVTKGAHVGVFHYDTNYTDAGKQFATAGGNTATALQNIAGAFFNNVTEPLVSTVTTGSNQIKWAKAVVKRSDSSENFIAYYEDLNSAVAEVNANDILDILCTHALSGSASIKNSCTIRNVKNPANDTENPFYETYTGTDGVQHRRDKYDAAKEPWVYFSKKADATADADSYRLTVEANTTVNLQGVVFSGYYLDDDKNSGESTRCKAGLQVEAKGNLYISNGASGGVLPDGTTTRTACNTIGGNFRNSSKGKGNDYAGSFIRTLGKVQINGGTFSWNAKDTPDNWTYVDGGSVVCAYGEDASFIFKGGYISNNFKYAGQGGYANSKGWQDTPVEIADGAKFEMYDGAVAQNNEGTQGGFLETNGGWTAAKREETSKTSCIFHGGKINNNKAYHGGAILVFCGSMQILGNTEIIGNFATTGQSAIRNVDYAKLTIGGTARIVNNTTTGTDGEGWDGAISQSDSNNTTVTFQETPLVYHNGRVDVEGGEIKKERNLLIRTADQLYANGVESGAKIGVCALTNGDAWITEGNDFGTINAGTTNYLNAFENDMNDDDNGYPLLGTASTNANKIKWSDKTPTVKVTETVASYVYNADGTIDYTNSKFIDVVHTFGGDNAIADAFAAVETFPATNVISGKKTDGTDKDYVGYFPIELLKYDYQISSPVTLTAEDRVVWFTTASPTATDGYPYKGNGGTITGDYAKARLQRTFNGDSCFIFSANSDVTITNMTIDGNRDHYSHSTAYPANCSGGLIRVEGSTNLNLGESLVLQNSVTNGYGGALFARYNTTCTITMQDDCKITNCKADYGGGVYMDVGTKLVMGVTTDSGGNEVTTHTPKITGCEATTCGGAIGAPTNSELVVGGKSEITGCWAKGFSAIHMGSRSVSLQVRDNVKIHDNWNVDGTPNGNRGAIGYDNNTGTGHITLSGNITIYDNTDSTKNKNTGQQNIYEQTALNNGGIIQVGTAGIGKEAKIGVFAETNQNVTNVFARTTAVTASTSTNAYNLNKFYNDRQGKLRGAAGSADTVVWSRQTPVKIYVHTDDTLPYDTTYTVEVMGAVTGTRTRFAVKVPANKNIGSILTTVPVATAGQVRQIDGGCPAQTTLSLFSGTYTEPSGTSVTIPASANGYVNTNATTSDKVQLNSGMLCTIMLDDTKESKGDIASTSGVRELHLKATQTVDDDTTAAVTDFKTVLNTFDTGSL